MATEGASEIPTVLVFLIFSKSRRSDDGWQPIVDDITVWLKHSMTAARLLRTKPLRPGHVWEGSFSAANSCPEMIACRELCQSTEVKDIEKAHTVEVIIQPSSLYLLHRQHGLAVFDMDSTLIQQEVIDELARAIGKYEQVAAITEAAMRGEAPYKDFEASLRARVALLKGVDAAIWDRLKAGTITFTPGARELIICLRELGWKTAVLSGGFTPLANWVKETLGLDYASANHLVNGVDDRGMDILTGELVQGAPIVHAQRKQDLLVQLATAYQVPLERTIAVGDGSNDLLMMKAAGLGIAFNAKPKVQVAAPARLNGTSLLDVMHVLGYEKAEIDKMLG